MILHIEKKLVKFTVLKPCINNPSIRNKVWNISEDQLKIGGDKPNQLSQYPSCRHYDIGEINFYEPDTPRSCSKGNSATLDKFFSDCGHLTGE